MLNGLAQNGNVARLRGSRHFSDMDNTATGGQRAPNPLMSTVRNTVSPYLSSNEVGTLQSEPMGMRVKDEGESEGRLVMRRIQGSTFPDAKAGKLPSGLL